MNRLKKQYNTEVAPKLQKELGISNKMAIPKIDKVIISIGTGRALKDAKLLDIMMENLRKITGQQPVKKAAKVSISNFGVRQGMTVGLQVTLRGEKMYDFIDKLVSLTLPRVRDFNGISRKSFDGNGNYSIGFKEQMVFPELIGDDIQKMHGLGITIKTTATTDEEALKLLELMGFPFTKNNAQ